LQVNPYLFYSDTTESIKLHLNIQSDSLKQTVQWTSATTDILRTNKRESYSRCH